MGAKVGGADDGDSLGLSVLGRSVGVKLGSAEFVGLLVRTIAVGAGEGDASTDGSLDGEKVGGSDGSSVGTVLDGESVSTLLNLLGVTDG